MNLPAKAGRRAALRRARDVAALLAVLAAFPVCALAGEAAVQPVLEAQKLDGSNFSLADSRGRVTVVVVWSPDSLAARKSLGELQRFTALYRTHELSVVAVSTLGDAERLRRFASERQLVLPLAIMERTSLGPFPEHSLPQVHVFDRSGNLHGSRSGLFRLRTLEEMVAPLL